MIGANTSDIFFKKYYLGCVVKYDVSKKPKSFFEAL